MTLGALRAVLTTALDEVDGFLAFDLVDHFGLHGGTRNHRRAQNRRIAAQHQHVVELDSLTCISGQFFHAQRIAGLDFVLFAAGFQNREHLSLPLLPRPVVPLRAFRQDDDPLGLLRFHRGQRALASDDE